MAVCKTCEAIYDGRRAKSYSHSELCSGCRAKVIENERVANAAKKAADDEATAKWNVAYKIAATKMLPYAKSFMPEIRRELIRAATVQGGCSLHDLYWRADKVIDAQLFDKVDSEALQFRVYVHDFPSYGEGDKMTARIYADKIVLYENGQETETFIKETIEYQAFRRTLGNITYDLAHSLIAAWEKLGE